MPMVRILEIDDNASATRTAPAPLQNAIGRPHPHRFFLRHLRFPPDSREHRDPFQHHCPKTNLFTVLPFPSPIHFSAGACSTMQGSPSDPCPSADGANPRKLRLAWCALLLAPLIFAVASLGRLLEWW